MPRRKITLTPAQKAAAEELPILKPEEEALIQFHGQGLDNSEAYRRAYGAEGYSPESLKVRACRKFAEPKIQAWLRALNRVGFANALITKDAWITWGMSKAAVAEEAGNHGAAQGYWKEIGKSLGFLIEQVDVNVTGDYHVTLRHIFEISPELARGLAVKYNVPLQKLENKRPIEH